MTPTTPKTLLPPNATRFQRDLELVNGITAGTLEAVENIKTIKSDPPIQVLYWLIWEYGLGELLPYISDLKLLINEGLNWQRLKGTPDSLKLALGWIGIDDMEIEEEVPGLYYYQFQLNLGNIPSRWEVDNIINLSKLTAPVRSRLSRLYNEEYDRRRLVLSNGEFGQLLSDYSGYHYKDIVLSFGNSRGYSLEIPQRETAVRQYREIKTKLRYPDYPLLSYMSCISELPIPNRPSVIHRYIVIRFAHPGNGPLSLAGLDWYGTWGQRTWEAPGFISLGFRQLTNHTYKLQFPELDSGKRRYTNHSYPVPIPEPGVTRTQESTHTRRDQIPAGSAGVRRYTTHRGGVQYPVIDVGSRLERQFSGQAVCTADESNPPRIARTRLYAAIQLRQTNGVPLCSAGTDWFGPWDERTWASPLFINIGVIHGNIN